MDTVVASMGAGQITVIAIGCGMGALLVGAVGAFFCIHSKNSWCYLLCCCCNVLRYKLEFSSLPRSSSSSNSPARCAHSHVSRYWRCYHDSVALSRRRRSKTGHRIYVCCVYANCVRASLSFAEIHKVRAVEVRSVVGRSALGSVLSGTFAGLFARGILTYLIAVISLLAGFRDLRGLYDAQAKKKRMLEQTEMSTSLRRRYRHYHRHHRYL